MKKIKDSIRNKELLALVITIVLYFLIRVVLLFVGAKFSETREDELLHLKMDTLMEIVSDGNAKRAAADATIYENQKANVNMMTNLLKEFATKDGYAGPRVFSDGFVAELQGERVILPREYRTFDTQITREMIDKGLASGEMMTGYATVGNAAPEEAAPEDMEKAEEAYVDELSKSCFLSFGKISENYVYVDLLSEIEYTEYLDLGSYNIYEALESADATFDGITVVIRDQDGELQLLRQFGAGKPFESLAGLGLTKELLYAETPSLTIDGQEYLCAFAELDNRRGEEEHLHIVQMLPRVSLKEQIATRSLLLGLVMEIILISVTVYVTSVQRYTAEHDLSEEQTERFRPEKMRRRMIAVGILSVVLTFAAALLIESVGQMYVELRYGKDTLNVIFEQYESKDRDQNRSIKREEESWFIYCGEKLAALLSDYPELNTRRKLQESCDILGIDYIMTFDPEGRQILCSRDYAGFRLDDETDEDMYDFRRLLHGVPSIVHEPVMNGMTGLVRQLIGVKMPEEKTSGMHGALLMALMPERTSSLSASFVSAGTQTRASARGTICFAADAATGEIVKSGNPAMIGRTIAECGLPERSLRDGYMDFTPIAGSNYLVITNRDTDHIYYYAVESGTVFQSIILYGLVVSLLFALVLAILLTFLFSGYSEKAFEEWAAIRARGKEKRAEKAKKQSEADSTKKEKRSLPQILRDNIHWSEKLPNQKVSIILHAGLIILILCTLDVLSGKSLPNESYDTMLGFLLHGDWMRGLNLFGLCSILVIIAIAYLVNIVCSWLLRLSAGLFAGHGETICRLLYSCIKYVTVIGAIYFSLEYLGFSAGAILASLGVVSLALSLGAQDLIADILAGLAVVFDGSFHVGDIVKINGTCGTVLEIGVRTTNLRVSGNNIMVINNHEIRDILNMSKELSEFRLELRVNADESLLRLEELLNRELPSIGRKNSKIVEGPYLLGVTSLRGCELGVQLQILTLSIDAVVKQKDSYDVKLYLNREIHLLFEREGVKLF